MYSSRSPLVKAAEMSTERSSRSSAAAIAKVVCIIAGRSVDACGNASALSSSTPTGLQSDADIHWLADMGATSHMTLHYAWMHNYMLYVVNIHQADNTVVQSAGIGSVVLNPVVNGSDARPVELTRVLHVPQLCNNLLSCIYLTKRKGIIMEVDASKICFKHNGTTLFTTTVTPHHTGIVDASTELNPESAHAALTLPMDINLWHCCCTHYSHATITKLIKGDLVVRLVISSKSQPDPICEACLAGKMTSGPFPSSDSISELPLELVHSDLHGPLPVATAEGYHYWMTFIDDCTNLQAVMYLRHKSNTFEVFKTFKVYAENQLNAKIKAVQDDKAGEYMSAAFHKFMDQCGIARRHSTRNRPQQNGVAERCDGWGTFAASDDLVILSYLARDLYLLVLFP